MDDTTTLYDVGTILEVDFETKSGSKNPHEPWKIKGVLRVDTTGLARKDIEPDLLASWKIKRQRCREAMSRDEAYACMTEVVSWSDVGKVGSTPVDVDAAFHSKFAGMTDEQQEEHIAKLTAMRKSGFGG